MRAYDEDRAAATTAHGGALQAELGTTEQRVAAAHEPSALDVKATLALQRFAGNASVSSLVEDDPSPVLGVVDSGLGQPLDSATRETMEQALGSDFGNVRIHTDADAAASAQAVRAKAYTVGEDLAFQSGEYAPSTENGKRTLAHELTHVIQQRSGPVDGTPSGGGIAVSHPSDRFEQEAETNADRVVHGGEAGAHAPESSATGEGGTGANATVQREIDDELGEEE